MTTHATLAPSAAAPATGLPSGARRAAARKAALHWIAVHALGIAAALFFVLPFVFVFLTAVMSDSQALTRDLWPRTWEWGNFTTVWDTPDSSPGGATPCCTRASARC